MEQAKAIEYLTEKQDFFFGDEGCSEELINALVNTHDEFLPILNGISLKNPSTVQLIAVFPGSLGVDRLYLGDIKNALLKYITLGGLGIWWIKDIFSAKRRCREYNCKKLLEAINNPSAVVVKDRNATEGKIKKAFAIAKAVAPALKKGAKDIQDSFEVK